MSLCLLRHGEGGDELSLQCRNGESKGERLRFEADVDAVGLDPYLVKRGETTLAVNGYVVAECGEDVFLEDLIVAARAMLSEVVDLGDAALVVEEGKPSVREDTRR